MSMPIQLIAVPIADLHTIAAGGVPAHLTGSAHAGALLPAFVARRSLDQIAAGKPRAWCSTFYIIRTHDRSLAGSCGFKDAPLDGQVEIGYGVAPACRNAGIAGAAVAALLKIAAASADVHHVLAQVDAGNAASTRVMRKSGFRDSGSKPDNDGDLFVQWVAAV